MTATGATAGQKTVAATKIFGAFAMIVAVFETIAVTATRRSSRAAAAPSGR
jgi:hypothetical protein